MIINTEKFNAVYSKFFKTKKWDKQFLYSKSGIVNLIFSQEVDYFAAPIGTSDVDFCIEGDFSQVVTIFRSASDSINCSINKDKLKLATNDEKITCIVIVKESNFEFTKDFEGGFNINLNPQELQIFSKFSGDTYPTNMVYCDLSSKSLFSASDRSILSAFRFKESNFAIDKYICNILGANIHIDKPVAHASVIDSIGKLMVAIYKANQEIKEYTDMVVPLVEYNELTYDDFEGLINPHFNLSSPHINIDFTDASIVKFKSANDIQNSTLGMQTKSKYSSNYKTDITFKTKDLFNLMKLIEGQDIKIGFHPEFPNVSCVCTDKYFFASL